MIYSSNSQLSPQAPAMRNTIRCCISCILPCGALDVIRIVHSNGRVEEISGATTIQASQIMKSYPKHVLKKPSSPSDVGDNAAPKIIVVPPDALLQRGKIYFLMPSAAAAATTGAAKPKKSLPKNRVPVQPSRNRETHHHHQRIGGGGSGGGGGGRSKGSGNVNSNINSKGNGASIPAATAAGEEVSDRYLSEILSEKVSTTHRDRRRGRVNVWRPHLESISESTLISATTDQSHSLTTSF